MTKKPKKKLTIEETFENAIKKLARVKKPKKKST